MNIELELEKGSGLEALVNRHSKGVLPSSVKSYQEGESGESLVITYDFFDGSNYAFKKTRLSKDEPAQTNSFYSVVKRLFNRNEISGKPFGGSDPVFYSANFYSQDGQILGDATLSNHPKVMEYSVINGAVKQQLKSHFDGLSHLYKEIEHEIRDVDRLNDEKAGLLGHIRNFSMFSYLLRTALNNNPSYYAKERDVIKDWGIKAGGDPTYSIPVVVRRAGNNFK